jgi:hypothetical protein
LFDKKAISTAIVEARSYTLMPSNSLPGVFCRWFFDARLALALIFWLAGSGMANASWLDDDYYCRVYGCIVVSDGSAFDIYDRYRFAGGGTVAPGSELIAWTGNPYEGSGTVELLETGTLTPVNESLSSSLLGIDEDGDGIADLFPNDANNSGVLDLGDSLTPFAAGSKLDFSGNGITRSLYVAARMDFSLYLQASSLGGEGTMPSSLSPDAVNFALSVTQRGNDGGFSFGSRAVNPDFVPTAGVSSLGDIWQIPVEAAAFRRSSGTHNRRSNRVADQSVRLDMLLDAPAVGLEAGSGEAQYQLDFRFYNR